MTDATWTDDEARTRQFWLRTILVVGLLWGFLPFVMAPFITRGAHDTTYDIAASILNSLTILPACALAFWHRRIACIWMSVNAVVLAGALADFILRTRRLDSTMIAEVAGPIAFAVFLDFVEARRWPAALEKQAARTRGAWD